MAFDAYFKLDGGIITGDVEGESQAAGWENWIEVDSFELGAENPVQIDSKSGGASTGKPEFKSLIIEKTPDRTSPALFAACCTGEHYKRGFLSLCKSGGTAKKPTPFLEFKFKLVLIESIENSGRRVDDVPMERFVLKFGAIEWNYIPQDQSGKLGDKVGSAWSQVLNSKSFEVPGDPDV